ncbi:MAG: hypothetical protein ACYC66_07130 [Chloroflexota bacterium]
MVNLPFQTADARLAESWFTALADSLEELLGSLGSQAILSRALEDARRRWPPLTQVVLKPHGLDLSRLYSNYPGSQGQACSHEAAVALQGLVDSLRFLLEVLLGRQIAAELMPCRDGGHGEADCQEDRKSGCA